MYDIGGYATEPSYASAPAVDTWFRIHDFWTIDDIVYQPPQTVDRFATFDQVDFTPYRLTYEIEILKGCEPEIVSISASAFSTKTRSMEPVKLSGGLEELAREYLQDDHSRWTDMRDWMLEHGHRVEGRWAI